MAAVIQSYQNLLTAGRPLAALLPAAVLALLLCAGPAPVPQARRRNGG
jgi:hypothetical protein